MSDYGYVSDRAKKAFATVARLEGECARSPGNRALSINLASMRRVAEQARLELERLAAYNQIEICEYRLVPVEASEYGLAHVSKTLLEYQNLFTQIYDAMKNGKKSRAHFGQEAQQESMLDFAYSYSGSLGVVLLARSERDFLGGNLDQPIEALYQILDISDVDNVKDIAHTLGRAVVKRVHDWSKANVDGGFSADIRWKRSDGRLLGQMIDKDKLQNIVEFIDATADEATTTIFIQGMLVGGNVASRTFHITVPDGDTYTGHIGEDAALPAAMTLGRIYDAEIQVAEKYFYATERTTKANTLVRLAGPLDLPVFG